MWLNMNWRRMIGDMYWKSYYYYRPEITKLLENCKYTDQDDHIASCARGMAMADSVIFLLFKLNIELNYLYQFHYEISVAPAPSEKTIYVRLD